MARLIWALFCEHHLTDANGKNSYISIFDRTTVGIRAKEGAPPLWEPLPHPVPTPPFVLALHMTTEPGTPECTVRVRDSDDQDLVPPITARLPDNPEGRHNFHLNFAQGIPVQKSGIYAFQVFMEDKLIGQKELPVSLDLG